jgi:hypothetical protein
LPAGSATPDQRGKDYGNILETFRPGRLHPPAQIRGKYGTRAAVSSLHDRNSPPWRRVAKSGCLKYVRSSKLHDVIGDEVDMFESWEHVPVTRFFALVADVRA